MCVITVIDKFRNVIAENARKIEGRLVLDVVAGGFPWRYTFEYTMHNMRVEIPAESIIGGCYLVMKGDTIVIHDVAISNARGDTLDLLAGAFDE